MPQARTAVLSTSVLIAVVVVPVGLHDLVLYRNGTFPTDYCRVSAQSAAKRGLQPGELTTAEADSGCRLGEVHECGYGRFMLSDVIEVKRAPC